MVQQSSRLAVVSSLVLILGGCAAGAPGTSTRVDPFAADRQSDEVLLTVQNNDFRDASIYAVWNGVRKRVGSVTSPAVMPS